MKAEQNTLEQEILLLQQERRLEWDEKYRLLTQLIEGSRPQA